VGERGPSAVAGEMFERLAVVIGDHEALAPEILVQYQAFPWALLATRARQAEDLGARTVMIRLNVALAR
jgi:hypothetical protein